MAKSKTFLWPQGILIALLLLSASLSISLMLFIKPNASDSWPGVAIAQGRGSVKINNLPAAKVGTQDRIEQLKAAMLTSWEQEANTKGVTSIAPPGFQGATIKAGKVNQDQKVIALTFDDGPWPETTSQVLDILKKNKIKATFFVVGQNVKKYPHLLKRVIADGHGIGNHTWHHWYHYMNANAAAYEVDHTTEIIYQVTGVKTNLFRPPGGIMHNGVAAYARNNRYAIVLWSSDSLDYSVSTVPNLVNNVFRNAQPGGIVLLHDGGGNRSRTVQALPEIISKFRQQGYSFVTIPELLVMEDKNQRLLANKK